MAISQFSRACSHYDVIMRSYIYWWHLFWYQWKEDVHTYTLVVKVIWPSVLIILGVATTPLRKICLGKTLRRTRVKRSSEKREYTPSLSSSASHKSPIPSPSLSAWPTLDTNWQLSGAASRIPVQCHKMKEFGVCTKLILIQIIASILINEKKKFLSYWTQPEPSARVLTT